MLAIGAIDLHDRGALRGDAIVATVMSNLGLRRVLEPYSISVVETPVGDRNVLEALEQRNLVLGGEQSGHVIDADHATTGDGTLTGIFLLDTMVRRGRTLSELAVGDAGGAAGAAQRPGGGSGRPQRRRRLLEPGPRRRRGARGRRPGARRGPRARSPRCG